MRERGNATRALNTFRGWLSRRFIYWKRNCEYEMGGLGTDREEGEGGTMVKESKQFQQVTTLEENVWLKKKKRGIIIFDTPYQGLEPLKFSSVTASWQSWTPVSSGLSDFTPTTNFTHSLFKTAVGSSGTLEKRRSPACGIVVVTIASGWRAPEGICWVGGETMLAAASKSPALSKAAHWTPFRPANVWLLMAER